MLSVPGQYKSVALMLDYKLDFSCCANKDGFRRDSHIYCMTRNISVELNFAVGESNSMSQNFILPTFNTCVVDTLLNSYITNIKSASI